MPSIVLKGDTSNIEAALRRIGALGRNPQAVLAAVGEQVVLNTQHRIERGVDPSGNPWKPLNPMYAATKQGPGILRGPDSSSAGLYASLVSSAQGTTLRWGSNKIYARIHQLGGVIKPVKAKALFFQLGGHEVIAGSVRIPARPYLGFTAQDREDLVGELDGFLKRAMRPL